jgi:hypothetical protein
VHRGPGLKCSTEIVGRRLLSEAGAQPDSLSAPRGEAAPVAPARAWGEDSRLGGAKDTKKEGEGMAAAGLRTARGRLPDGALRQAALE